MRDPATGRGVLLGLLLLLLTACSSAAAGESVATLQDGAATTETPGDTGAPVDREEALLAFAECMREQGIDMPDPQVGDDGQIGFGGNRPGGSDVDRDAIREARTACSDNLEGLEGGRRGDGQVDPETQLAFAECMRDEGIADFPDPSADGRPDIDALQSLDLDSRAFQDAAETCREQTGARGGRFGGGRR